MGRFMTPDWAAKPTAVPYASFGNPQSLNLYAYVKNNPVTTRDPDGHCDLCQRVLNWLNNEGWKTDKEVLHEWATQDRKFLTNEAGLSKTGVSQLSDRQVVDVFKAYENGQSSVVSEGAKILIGVMVGANGTQVISKTLWSEGDAHIDVENPNPGQRPGQIHYQDSTGKYIYDIESGQFKDISATKNRELLSNPEVQQAIQKGLKYLGETQ